MAKSKAADYNSTFAHNLRELLEKHPQTGVRTTYQVLGTKLGVKPQSVSQWANGDTTPDMKHIVPIAKYFGVDANYLLTGVSAENETVWKDLGLHENAVRELKQLKTLCDNGEATSISILVLLNLLLRTDAMIRLYGMLNQYVYDTLENSEQLKAAQAELDAAIADPERQKDKVYLNRLVQKAKSFEDNTDLVWYKAAHKAREIMKVIVDKVGGFEKTAYTVCGGHGRVVQWETELFGEPDGVIVPHGEKSESVF